MIINVIPYKLRDSFLFEGSGNGYLIWQPETNYIVPGQSDFPEKSLIIENVLRDGLPVTRRPTGSEAEVLTSSMLVITVAKVITEVTPFRIFFSEVTDWVFESLKKGGISDLGINGISDITIDNRKIPGSSLRCHKNRFVYHAVLNVREDSEVIENYLRHPRREPSYRSGRSHNEFVSFLYKAGYNITPEELIPILTRNIAGNIMGSLA